jgi:hypothetical protein
LLGEVETFGSMELRFFCLMQAVATCLLPDM